MAARDTAPGPDGIPGKIWALALGVLGPQLRRLFDRCLELGQFPPQWRRGRMVLQKKEGRPADSPSAYRPICLLDEAGKLFERRTAAALGRLLPNLGGPEMMVRRLYAGVVRSMALYGSPVWANDLMASRRSRALLRRIERRMAIRCVRGYRTTWYAAAMALAGLVPLELQAEVDAEMYDRVKALRLSGISPPEVARWATISKRRAQRRVLEKWRSQLAEPANASKRAVGAVLPNFEKWMGRTCGRLTYRVTQVLTGHGCFGEYLRRIGKEATAQCHHCGEEEDTTHHTLEACPAWSAQRRTVRSIVGADLSPPVLVQRMLEGKVQWDAVASFCEDVMSRKEAAERERERTDPARRALGRGRRRGGASARTSRPRPT
ncbi:Retrovirus-related Pol polyprotein from type-1 retrotransposable element R1 4 (Fragment) [Anthophora quadrimaculata]